MSLPRIAVDAMGGDVGVRVMIEGAALARRRHDRFKFLLVGDETRIKAALEKHPNLRASSEILHTDDVISGEDKPSQALRRAKTTRSEEHTSELQSLMRIAYAVFFLKNKKLIHHIRTQRTQEHA